MIIQACSQLDHQVKGYIDENLKPAKIKPDTFLKFHLIRDGQSNCLVSKITLVAIRTFKLRLDVQTQAQLLKGCPTAPKNEAEFRDEMADFPSISLPEKPGKKAVEEAARAKVEEMLVEDFSEPLFVFLLEVGNKPYLLSAYPSDIDAEFKLEHRIIPNTHLDRFPKIKEKLPTMPQIKMEAAPIKSRPTPIPSAYLSNGVEYKISLELQNGLKGERGKDHHIPWSVLTRAIDKKHKNMKKSEKEERFSYYFCQKPQNRVLNMVAEHHPGQINETGNKIINVVTAYYPKHNVLLSINSGSEARLNSWKGNLSKI